MVWNGKIELLRRRADGTNLVMEQLRSGRYFGELAPIFGLPCSMTARAATKAVVTGYTIADFRRQVGAPSMDDLITWRRHPAAEQSRGRDRGAGRGPIDAGWHPGDHRYLLAIRS